MIRKKIMAIIKSDKGNFLILKTNPKHMKVDEWFVVTGNLEENEDYNEAVKREISEETKLEIINIKQTPVSFDYEWPKNSGKRYHEKVFLVKVKEAPAKITKWEHLEYKWLKEEDFLKEITWHGNKIELKKLVREIK